MFNRKFVIRFTLGDILKGIVCSPVLIIIVAGIICLPWESANAPAWVQAIGSVLAIVVAVWVAQHQAESHLTATRAQNVDLVKKLSIILKRVFTDAHRAGDASHDPTNLINQQILDGLKYGNRMVQNIDPISVPTAELMSKWLAIKDVLQALERDFEFFIKANPSTDQERLEKDIKRHALRVNRDYFVKWRIEFDDLVESFSG